MTQNTLRLIVAVAAALLFAFVLNWMVDDLFNFLYTGGAEDQEGPFNPDDPIWTVTKIAGSIAIVYFVCRGSGD